MGCDPKKFPGFVHTQRGHFFEDDPEFGRRVAAGIGVDLDDAVDADLTALADEEIRDADEVAELLDRPPLLHRVEEQRRGVGLASTDEAVVLIDAVDRRELNLDSGSAPWNR